MFITNAYAQSSASSFSLENISSFLPIILMFVILYFLMIRPQQKRQKEQRDMISALSPGDEIVTSGGILGKVTKISEHYVTIEIADGTEMTVQKPSIMTLLPKGTINSIQLVNK